MKERKGNEMAFFTANGLIVSFLSPLPIKWTKIYRKRIPQILILLVRKDGEEDKATSLH